MSMTFGEQVASAIPDLRRYARSLTGETHEADDLLQDTLERALMKQHLYVEAGALVGWLHAIMRNLFFDRTRRRKRRNRVESVNIDDIEIAASVPSNQEDHRFLSELEGLFARLPSDSVEILMTVGVQGKSYDHAATRLNVACGTIRSRLSRSRSALLNAALTTAPEPRGAGKARAGATEYRAARRSERPLGLWDRRTDRAVPRI